MVCLQRDGSRRQRRTNYPNVWERDKRHYFRRHAQSSCIKPYNRQQKEENSRAHRRVLPIRKEIRVLYNICLGIQHMVARVYIKMVKYIESRGISMNRGIERQLR